MILYKALLAKVLVVTCAFASMGTGSYLDKEHISKGLEGDKDSNIQLQESKEEIEDSKLCLLEPFRKTKFEGKDPNGTPTVEDCKMVTYSFIETTEPEFNPFGLKVIFKSEGNISIPKLGGGSIYIKKNTNTEFKINENGKDLSLGKAWTPNILASKVGISKCDDGTKECTLGDKINVIIDGIESEYSLDDINRIKKLKYEEDKENHNQGIKFYVETEISLSDSKKIEPFISYEIKESAGKWYLLKKEVFNDPR